MVGKVKRPPPPPYSRRRLTATLFFVLPIGKNPSQVAQAETPLPPSSISPGAPPAIWPAPPVQMTSVFRLIYFIAAVADGAERGAIFETRPKTMVSQIIRVPTCSACAFISLHQPRTLHHVAENRW